MEKPLKCNVLFAATDTRHIFTHCKSISETKNNLKFMRSVCIVRNLNPIVSVSVSNMNLKKSCTGASQDIITMIKL